MTVVWVDIGYTHTPLLSENQGFPSPCYIPRTLLVTHGKATFSSCFPHCCDKIFDKNSLREEGSILAHSLKATEHHGRKSWWLECEQLITLRKSQESER